MLKHTSEEHIKLHQDLTLEKFCHMLGKAEYERDFARRALVKSGRNDLIEDIKGWKRKCARLEEERRSSKHDFKVYQEEVEEIISSHKETNSKLKLCIENLIAVMETAIYYGDWEVDNAFNPKTDLASAKKLVNLPKNSLSLYEHPKAAK